MILMAETRISAVQVLGADGEITLGKEHAGRAVAVSELEPGVWIVKVGQFIPDSERWLLDPVVQADLDEAIAWADQNPRQTSDLQQIEEKLLGELPADSGSSRSE